MTLKDTFGVESTTVSPSRRELLAWVGGLFLALHEQGMGGVSAAQAAVQPGVAAGKPRLLRLQLKTHALDETDRFYSETIGFKRVSRTPRAVVFDAGATRLEFERVEDGSKPFYHFAFNIPENKIELAKPWLGARVPILRHARNGNDVIFFEQWNAHSLFFHDPAGNLVELIARHTLPTAADGPFGLADILCASEIGLVPAQQEAVFDEIREKLQIAAYLDSRSFLGDEHGIIIVIPKDIKWIPEFTQSGIRCPTRVTVTGHGARRIYLDEGPFEIVGVA